MAPKGLKWLLVVLSIWLATVLALAGWWGKFMLKQAARIEDLEAKLGTMPTDGLSSRTAHMLFWESSVYFIVVILGLVFLLWIYFRDIKRTKSLHAFFASVTHELRTPLTSIRLQAESIAEDIGQEAKKASVQKMVSRLLEDTSRLEGQVERTLELARIEGGGPLHTQAVHFKSWTERMVSSFAENHKGRFNFKIKLGEEYIEADTSALQVIMRNLLENTLRHSGRPSAQVKLESKTLTDGKVEIMYEDDGQGLTLALQNVGRLFSKGESSSGAGVGLYLVNTLMSRMGGAVRYSNEPGFKAVLTFKVAS